MRALVILAAIVITATAAAHTVRAQSCDGLSADGARARTQRIAERLRQQKRKTRTWSLTFGIGYALTAAGSATAGFLIDDEDRRVDLYVTAGKAAIGSLSLVVLPVRVTEAPAPTGDVCADLAAAKKALDASAESQAKGRGFIKQVGGLALAGAGIAIAGSQHGDYLRASVLALGGLAVGQLQIWTQPVGARDLGRSLAVVPVVAPGYAMLSIVGEL